MSEEINPMHLTMAQNMKIRNTVPVRSGYVAGAKMVHTTSPQNVKTAMRPMHV